MIFKTHKHEGHKGDKGLQLRNMALSLRQSSVMIESKSTKPSINSPS